METGDSKTVTQAQPRTTTPADRVPDHLFARGHARPESTAEGPRIDQTRLIQRVARAIEAAPQRGGTIRLRLSPPELGSLQMEISMHKGVLSARLETETHMARAVLLDNLPQLRDRLAEQGVRVEHFEVDVSQRDASDSQQQSQNSRELFETSSAHRGGNRPPDATRDVEGSTKTRRFIHHGNLNVVI